MKNDRTWKDCLATSLDSESARFWSVIRDIKAQGGLTLVVGGWVRDFIRGQEAKDVDVEVYGVAPGKLSSILGTHGEVDTIGAAFGILKIHGLDVDFSIPRSESKAGLGHTGFEILSDPNLSPDEAARRRDLTINAISLDLHTGRIVDPYNGLEDLKAARLRPTDPEKFVEDPLRVYRVAQFAARFEYTPTDDLVRLCSEMEPEGLPSERILGEFDKMLLAGSRPSLGLAFLRQCGWISHHPELAALIGCPQEQEWHPEGDVWEHTLLTVDAAASLRTGLSHDDRIVMCAALCHDLGKPLTTEFSDGRIRSLGHCKAGTLPTRQFLDRLTQESSFTQAVVKLVVSHLAPTSNHAGGAGPAAVRRLAKKLVPEANIDLLVRVARADHFGRGQSDESELTFAAGDWLLALSEELSVKEAAEPPVLMGRHLIAAGLSPGPIFGELLKRAYDIQMDEGIHEPAMLLGKVLPQDQ